MSNKAILVVMLLALALAPLPSVAQDFDAGQAAYERRDYASALLEWLPLAEDGQLDAQHMVGLLYHNGFKSNEMAFHWVSRAAKQGYALSQSYLADMYSRGQGIPQDYVTAHMWRNIALSGDWTSPRHEAEETALLIFWARVSQNRLEVIMPPDAVIEAQRRARVCMRSGYRDCE